MTPQARGIKLIGLYRRGVGGERENAGRLLLTHLKQHDLTLYDLDQSLPVTQDIRALDQYRDGAALLARLGDDPQGEVLLQLVDAEDLTSAEVRRVLDRVDLDRLAQSRLEGSAHVAGLPVGDLQQAAARVTPDQLMAGSGSLAQRFLQAIRQQHWNLQHPERLIRASDPLAQHLILGLVRGLTGQTGQADAAGVRAHLDPDQLTRLRTLMAHHLPHLTSRALAEAEALAFSSVRTLP
ncbi:hypothetical protein LAJ19_17745 (plasmid) [Deinococcus taeanensis]|uniref:hypothetical protein n=1 Tax=Deinococcus taeanensis TaxID=2737050 RepID=UPI001CDBA8B1|nr:hypothetical protein [Deinococcus taeanensis]UBV44615.1 hypothetical protein LAJ19_17745 [Deinococcus taeanensis]